MNARRDDIARAYAQIVEKASETTYAFGERGIGEATFAVDYSDLSAVGPLAPP